MITSKNTLYFTEITPPTGVWKNIEAALDDPIASQEFPAKLYKMEAEPPAASWAAIAAGLQSTTVTQPVKIPVHKPIFPIAMRYVAAAAICGLVAIFVLRSTKTSSTQVETAGVEPVISLPALNTQGNVTTNPVAQETPVETPKAKIAAITNGNNLPIRRAVVKQKATDEWNDLQYHQSLQPTVYGDVEKNDCWYEDHKASISNNYITLLNKDKKIIRISKKVGHLDCCIAGERVDTECAQTVKKYQDKLAQMSSTNAEANAIELLQIIQSMEK